MTTLQRPKIVKRLSWQDPSPDSSRIQLTRRIVQLQGNKVSADILEQAKQICNDYVEAKLKREGFKSRGWSFTFRESSASRQASGEMVSQVSIRVQEVGRLLEQSYPRLYKDISGRINVPFNSENTVHDVFNNVSSEILSDGLNWARIVALYTFAGALVVECCKEGRNSYVLDIGNWMYEFAALYMADWIKGKGGWEDLLRAFPSVTSTGSGAWIDGQATHWYSWLLMTVGAWCETAFEFLEYCFKAYMERMRKMNTGSRKISR